jgi:phosphomannomutase
MVVLSLFSRTALGGKSPVNQPQATAHHTAQTTRLGSASTPQDSYAFGTAGFRTGQPDAFRKAVPIITHSIADYLTKEIKQNPDIPPVVLVGGDTRDLTQESLLKVSNIFVQRGFDVYLAPRPVTTPMLCYAAKHFEDLGMPHKKVAGAVVMTASHNPWDDGGYNFVTSQGAIVPTAASKEFEHFQKHPLRETLDRQKLGLSEEPEIRAAYLYPHYKKHLEDTLKIDFKAIKDSGLRIITDTLHGTGGLYFPKLLREHGIPVKTLNESIHRPEGYHGHPEPDAEMLADLRAHVKKANENGKPTLGFGLDGDSDRFGVVDQRGDMVKPNDVLLLTLYNNLRHRGDTQTGGVVVRSQATTHALDVLAKQHGMETIQTPVGFKYIGETMLEREAKGLSPMCLGGESSGGFTVRGHIPNKDGISANLLIAELAAKEKKPVHDILGDIRKQVGGTYVFQEYAIKTDKGTAIMDHYQKAVDAQGKLGGIGIDVEKTRQEGTRLKEQFGSQDGLKVYLEDGSWLLVRKSGTEPLARVYFEATSQEAADKLQGQVHHLLTKQLHIPAEHVKSK